MPSRTVSEWLEPSALRIWASEQSRQLLISKPPAARRVRSVGFLCSCIVVHNSSVRRFAQVSLGSPVLPQDGSDVPCVVETGDSTMSAITNKLIFDLIKQNYKNYRPYDTHAEFSRGFSACEAGDFRTRTRPTASPLRRGIAGWRLRRSIRRRAPPEPATASPPGPLGGFLLRSTALILLQLGGQGAIESRPDRTVR